MNGIIQQAVMQIKDDVGRALDTESIEAVCRAVGHIWRRRELDPAATLQGFLLQILHGNTACVLVQPELESRGQGVREHRAAPCRCSRGLRPQRFIA